MEFFIVLLSVLSGLLSPVGVVSERVAAGLIRDRLCRIEDLQVRIDNTPSYRLVQGRVDRIRIAGRGVFPQPDLRLEVVEIETDAIAVKPGQLTAGQVVLERPLRAGVRVVISQQDVNQVLRSPAIRNRVRQLSLNALGRAAPGSADQYELVNPQTTFLPGNRVRLQATLRSPRTRQELNILAEVGLTVVAGRRLRVINPSLRLNDQPAPAQLLQPLLTGFSQQLDLQLLERSGVTARVLQLETQGEELAIAVFVQVRPEAIEKFLAR